MNITVIKKLPAIEEIIQMFPLSENAYEQVVRNRHDVQNIISGKDKRMLVIVGPCSAWPYEAVLTYAKKLKVLDDKLKDHLKLVMRVYIQKPRTTKGWTGPVNQPNPIAPPDVEAGIKYARKLMVQVIEMGLSIADEALFTHNAKGFIELLAWAAIGARSTEDQEHRIFASAFDCPVGMKNPTSGSIEIGVNSLVAAQRAHTAVFHGNQVETHGNPYAHLVLRGGLDRPNYFLEDLQLSKKILEQSKIINPAIIVDASHDNCKVNGVKNHLKQIDVVEDVLESLLENKDLRPFVKGFMIESFLKDGAQKIDGIVPGKIDMEGLSITDPCLDWDRTEQLLNRVAEVSSKLNL